MILSVDWKGGLVGRNLVYGKGGDDAILFTGTGSNTVFGGAGNDTITGGPGADRIVAGPGERDLVTDFRLAEGDRLETGGQTYTVSQTADGSADITLANGSVVVLQGVGPGSVTTDYSV